MAASGISEWIPTQIEKASGHRRPPVPLVDVALREPGDARVTERSATKRIARLLPGYSLMATMLTSSACSFRRASVQTSSATASAKPYLR